MKNKIIKIFALLICITMLFFGCSYNSGLALGKIESSTRTRIKQSHLLLNGTEIKTLSLGNKQQKMEIEVVTEEGEIDITITGRNGEEIILLDDAETGVYEFSAKEKVKVKIEAKEHRGSFEIRKADS